MIETDNTKAQMRKGILEFCVLNIIARGEIYPSDILKELKSARMIVMEGTLYPLLTRLKNAGILNYSWVESRTGPPRKYYRLTEEGQVFLTELKSTWQELVHAVDSTQIAEPSNIENHA
jgi:PadR family transcriptional regulator, regulatory protein PadR